MSEPEQTPEQAVAAVYDFAASQMQNDASPEDIKQSLIDQGLDSESASVVVANLTEARSRAMRAAGQKNMLFGALWCIGGTVVTVVSFQQAAAAPGGGRYVLAWGAILFGAIQFFRGVIQAVGK